MKWFSADPVTAFSAINCTNAINYNVFSKVKFIAEKVMDDRSANGMRLRWLGFLLSYSILSFYGIHSKRLKIEASPQIDGINASEIQAQSRVMDHDHYKSSRCALLKKIIYNWNCVRTTEPKTAFGFRAVYPIIFWSQYLVEVFSCWSN